MTACPYAVLHVYQVTLNITMDAAFVPSESQGSRLDRASLVVLGTIKEGTQQNDAPVVLRTQSDQGSGVLSYMYQQLNSCPSLAFGCDF
jgi:hypothetical protein